MFNNTKKLTEEISKLKANIAVIVAENTELRKTASNLNEISEHKLKVLQEEQKGEILKATRELQEKYDKKSQEYEIEKAKSDMLEKAFKNIGFDVKDSKEMMSDLIKALGVKNTVQIVK